MRDRAVRLAIAHGGPSGRLRRIHEDVRCAVARQPLIAARGGIALDTPARRAAVAGPIEESTHCSDSFDTGSEAAKAGDAGIARVGALLRHQGKCNVKPIGRQERTGAVRPFDQQHRAFCRILEADFGKLGRAGQPVEIGVDEGETRQHISLRERKGRAWHLDAFIAGKETDESSGKSRLAGAKIAGQRNYVAGLDHCGDIRHQPVSASFVGQGRVEIVVAGCGGKHRIIR